MPTEPEPLTLADLARRAVQICDPQDTDAVLGDYFIQFEDADEPVTAIQNLEERVALAAEGVDVDVADPSIAVAIIRELGGRLARMNRSLAHLTYAAEALARDEYDSALLDKLTNLPGELANFGRAFAGMASEIRAKQNRRAELRAAAEIQQSILPPPWAPPRLPAKSGTEISMIAPV